MPKGQTSHRLYVHLTWCTAARADFFNYEVKKVLKSVVNKACEEQGFEIIAFNAGKDHVHLLVRFKPTHCIVLLVKTIKGRSSRLLTKRLGAPFKWQRGYSAHTVGYRSLETARQYVLNQEKHHSYSNS